MSKDRWTDGTVLAAAAILAVFVPLLAVVPYWFPVDTDVASAATAVGFNSRAAYYGAVLGCLGSVVIVGFLVNRGVLPDGTTESTQLSAESTSTGSGEPFPLLALGVLVSAVLVVYFPPFLDGQGPYFEDNFFLSLMHRMEVGQTPFVDFEFLYGPLMIYPAHWWSELFGFSLTSYYGYLALLEVLALGTLLVLIWRLIPGRRKALVAFFILGVLCLNVSLGPNQNALRKLVPVLAILLVAKKPRSNLALGGAALLIGLQLAYSQEYGIAGLGALVGLYVFLAWREETWYHLYRAAAGVGIVSLVWMVLTWALLRDGFGAYIEETLYLTARMEAGQSAFPFEWTVNSLAAFGLLALASVAVGTALGRGRARETLPGDHLMVGAFVYTLVALKSGLNRCDFWHLDPPFIALAFAFLLPWRRNAVPLPRTSRTLSIALLGVMAITYLFGLAPAGSHAARGWVDGFLDKIAGDRATPETSLSTRAPALEPERSEPRSDVMAVARLLSAPPNRDREVLFYGDTWSLDKMVGVPKRYYSNDKFLHSEERGEELRRFLRKEPDALVVIRRPTYERLFGLIPQDSFPELRSRYERTLTKTVGSYLSSVHFEAVLLEKPVREARWTRTVGRYVISHFEPMAEFGDLMILHNPAGGPK